MSLEWKVVKLQICSIHKDRTLSKYWWIDCYTLADSSSEWKFLNSFPCLKIFAAHNWKNLNSLQYVNSSCKGNFSQLIQRFKREENFVYLTSLYYSSNSWARTRQNSNDNDKRSVISKASTSLMFSLNQRKYLSYFTRET